tara:strand:- start:822 stop:1001 length:180 start_codon:yes stop_codon:yes gene_type:complete
MADQPIETDKKKPTNNNEESPAAPEEEENPEKEKNCEGKIIGGFVIGKTKGKGTFGKVK